MRDKVRWIVTGCALAATASPPVPEALTLNGRPFPAVARYVARVSPPQRTLSASPADDLQSIVRTLVRGDQLRVKRGVYPGNLKIDDKCRDGPIAVFFEDNAALVGSVAVRRSSWHFEGIEVREGGVTIDGSSVFLNRAQIHDGVKIFGSGVTISNSRITSDSAGIEVEPGARHIAIINNHVYDSPGGDIRVREARDVEIIGNTVRRGAAGISMVDSDNAMIADNTIQDTPGIALERVKHARIRSNHITGAEVGIAVGRLTSGADDVTIDHNDVETMSQSGAAVSIEAGNHVLVANNVIDGYPDGVLVLGEPRNVSVVNNLVLAVKRTAFVIHDPSSIRLFDFNIFSPAADAVRSEIGNEKLTLAEGLARAGMPHSRVIPGVQLLHHDLGRVAGVETVDRGTRVGIEFKGKAPDLGVNEQ
jgi:parallel beta-helix repeat protein